MSVVDLTVVREPNRLGGGRPSAMADGTAALAQRLATLSGRAVPLFEGFLRDAPGQGVLIARPSASFQHIMAEAETSILALTPRLILIGERRTDLLRILERWSLPAGIDDDRWHRWLSLGEGDIGAGICGLKSVAAGMTD